MKEETLEEAAKSEAFEFKVDYKPFKTDLDYREYAEYGFEKGFVDGANWQAERVYSLEDMIATFHYGHQIGMNNVLAIQSQHSPQPIPKPDLDSLKKEWFEQFKKK